MPDKPALRTLGIVSAAIALIAGILVLASARPVLADHPDCEVRDLGVLDADPESQLTAAGRWTTENCDSRFRHGSDAHTYRFELSEGGRIRIDLMSEGVDSYLYLLAEDGSRITDNDDGAGGLNARVERDLEPGVYLIEATTVGGRGRGPADYALAIGYVVGCEAIPLGSLEAGVDLTAAGTWTLDTCGSRFVVQHPAYAYAFTLPQDGRVLIDLISEHGDPVLSLVSPTAGVIGANDDGGGGRNARIEQYLPAGPYLIEATTYLERDLQPLVADFTLRIHLVDEAAAQRTFLLKIEETTVPDEVIAGEPFAVNYRVGNLGGGALPEGSSVILYAVAPREFERLNTISVSEDRWQAGVAYHSSPELANATSTALAEVQPITMTLSRPGPSWVFVAVLAFDADDEEIAWHGLWQNLRVVSGPTFGPVTVTIDGSEYAVAATADEEGLVTTTVTAAMEPEGEVAETVRGKAIYAAAVHALLLDGIFERPGLAGLKASGEPLAISIANASSDTLYQAFAEQYADAVERSGLAETLAAGEAINPLAVEDLVLRMADGSARYYAALSASWSALAERVAGGGAISFAEAVALHSELAYAERILAPLAAAGDTVRTARAAEAGWQDPAVRAMIDDLAVQASCGAEPYQLGFSFLVAALAEVEDLRALHAELRDALPLFGFGSDAALCAASSVDGENARFLHRLGIFSDPEISSLHAPDQPPGATLDPPAEPHQLRIIARLTENGTVEHGVELADGQQTLPRARLLQADAPVALWHVTSDIVLYEETLGKVRTRRLADGRIELGFRDTTGRAITPDLLFLPAEMPVGVWFRSSAIEVAATPPAAE